MENQKKLKDLTKRFFLAKKEKSCIIERYAQSILVGGKNL